MSSWPNPRCSASAGEGADVHSLHEGVLMHGQERGSLHAPLLLGAASIEIHVRSSMGAKPRMH